jgi:thiosulfate/3-mercaptopyruvate sulfurtransferase
MSGKHRLVLALAFVTAMAVAALSQAAHAAGPLVTTAWLRQHLQDKNLFVLDVFVGDHRKAFAAGHIPGAVYTDFSADGWRATINGVKGLLPPVRDAEKVIGKLGIDNDSYVVVVPGGRNNADFNASARVYWTLKVLGHDKVSILDGGDKAWFADVDNPTETGMTAPTPKTFVADFRPALLATRDEVKAALNARDTTLIDARDPAQFEGKAKSSSVRVAGTLPGAVNAPSDRLAATDGTRPADRATIDSVLARAGVKGGKQIAFCNTGNLAAGAWFVLHEVVGNKQARLYDGSMADWTSDPGLPVANKPRG